MSASGRKTKTIIAIAVLVAAAAAAALLWQGGMVRPPPETNGEKPPPPPSARALAELLARLPESATFLLATGDLGGLAGALR